MEYLGSIQGWRQERDIHGQVGGDYENIDRRTVYSIDSLLTLWIAIITIQLVVRESH